MSENSLAGMIVVVIGLFISGYIFFISFRKYLQGYGLLTYKNVSFRGQPSDKYVRGKRARSGKGRLLIRIIISLAISLMFIYLGSYFLSS